MAFRPALALFAAFYLNLFLCFGIGIRELTAKKIRPVFQTVYIWTIIALVTFLLWVFFERVLVFIPGIPVYLLLYPCSLFACIGLEIFLFEMFPALGENPGIFRLGSPYSAFSLASLYLTIQFASGFIDALLLALAFSAGAIAAYFAVHEIRRRSFLETAPRGLRGNPLIIISAGLLSFVLTAAALLAIRALEG
jgi:Na+-translocating ferredoxin:NAD+ oxidoreductase RnfA subunit